MWRAESACQCQEMGFELQKPGRADRLSLKRTRSVTVDSESESVAGA